MYGESDGGKRQRWRKFYSIFLTCSRLGLNQDLRLRTPPFYPIELQEHNSMRRKTQIVSCYTKPTNGREYSQKTAEGQLK